MKDFLLENGIEHFALVSLRECKILKQYLLEKNGFDEGANAIMMLIPYRTEIRPQNLSVYASVLDYHLFIKELSARLESYALEK